MYWYIKIFRPGKTLGYTLLGYLKSVAFMSLYVAILKYSLCKSKNLRHIVDGILTNIHIKEN